MPNDKADYGIMSRLKAHRALGGMPVAEHEWLARHGTLRTFARGEVLMKGGEKATLMHIVFTGRLVIRADRGAGSHKIHDWGAGDVSGLMPYSRGATPPSDVVIEAEAEMLMIDRAHFTELTRECPNVTAALVHALLDRARLFTTVDLRDEKLVSLGRLAAGLAHELNNPASAVLRGAKTLAGAQASADRASRRLGAANLDAAQLAAIDAIRDRCGDQAPPLARGAMERADREDAIADWLRDHGANEDCAGPLADTGLSLAELDALAAVVHGQTLDAALSWISSGVAVRALAAEIELAASRIRDIVGAVKGYTYMDAAPAVESVDVGKGMRDTLTLLGNKTRAKAIAVSLDVPEGLPCAHGVGAELNQVWMNLFDNALDALPNGGHLFVRVRQEGDRLVVQVEDDGPGIPKEIQGRIFDPFFTTKGVGKGTGLGLDIVRRLLQKHEIEIELESTPGRTVFSVLLPVVTPNGGKD